MTLCTYILNNPLHISLLQWCALVFFIFLKIGIPIFYINCQLIFSLPLSPPFLLFPPLFLPPPTILPSNIYQFYTLPNITLGSGDPELNKLWFLKRTIWDDRQVHELLQCDIMMAEKGMHKGLSISRKSGEQRLAASEWLL